MAVLFSKRLLAGTTAAGVPLSAVVPPGHIWIIRNISAICRETGAAQAAVLISGGPYIWVNNHVVDTDTSHFDGRQVLNAGETLQCVPWPLEMDFYISGYELSTP